MLSQACIQLAADNPRRSWLWEAVREPFNVWRHCLFTALLIHWLITTAQPFPSSWKLSHRSPSQKSRRSEIMCGLLRNGNFFFVSLFLRKPCCQVVDSLGNRSTWSDGKEKLVKDDRTFCPNLFWDSHSQHKICDGLFPMTFAKWVHVYTFLVLRS